MIDGAPILVVWEDSRGVVEQWAEAESVMDHGTCTIRSVGWVIKETASLIHLAPHVGSDPEQCCGNMVIPRSAVVSMTRLNDGGVRRARVRKAVKKVLYKRAARGSEV